MVKRHQSSKSGIFHPTVIMAAHSSKENHRNCLSNSNNDSVNLHLPRTAPQSKLHRCKFSPLSSK
jgi:hypothetical protein